MCYESSLFTVYKTCDQSSFVTLYSSIICKPYICLFQLRYYPLLEVGSDTIHCSIAKVHCDFKKLKNTLPSDLHLCTVVRWEPWPPLKYHPFFLIVSSLCHFLFSVDSDSSQYSSHLSLGPPTFSFLVAYYPNSPIPDYTLPVHLPISS